MFIRFIIVTLIVSLASVSFADLFGDLQTMDHLAKHHKAEGVVHGHHHDDLLASTEKPDTQPPSQDNDVNHKHCVHSSGISFLVNVSQVEWEQKNYSLIVENLLTLDSYRPSPYLSSLFRPPRV